MLETWVRSLGWEDPLEEGMATHCSILAWRIPTVRGAWWATVHGVAMSQAWLSNEHNKAGDLRGLLLRPGTVLRLTAPSWLDPWHSGLSAEFSCFFGLHSQAAPYLEDSIWELAPGFRGPSPAGHCQKHLLRPESKTSCCHLSLFSLFLFFKTTIVASVFQGRCYGPRCFGKLLAGLSH